MIAQEVERECAKRFPKATQQTGESAFLAIFITGTAKEMKVMRNAPCRYGERVPAGVGNKQT